MRKGRPILDFLKTESPYSRLFVNQADITPRQTKSSPTESAAEEEPKELDIEDALEEQLEKLAEKAEVEADVEAYDEWRKEHGSTYVEAQVIDVEE